MSKPYPPEKLQDFFRFYDPQNPNQRSAILQLGQAILATAPELLTPESGWIKTYRQPVIAPKPAAIVAPSGLIGPKISPQQRGMQPADYHLIANARTKKVKAFNFKGQQLWELPCLLDGQHPNWRKNRGDTPPGLYKLGQMWNDVAKYGKSPAMTPQLLSYGWITWDLVDCEGNEDNNGRAGICLHGGGGALGWPGAWQPLQPLVSTWGCPRMHNLHLWQYVLPLYESGTVYFSVLQDDE